MTAERAIQVEVSLGFPSIREMRADIDKLSGMREKCKHAISGFQSQIIEQRSEQRQLNALARNPVGDDGITYNPDACRKAAKRCDKHIGMFEATIKKEQAKIDQLVYMISEIEHRIAILKDPGILERRVTEEAIQEQLNQDFEKRLKD
jgi:hypothetical protein